MNTENEILSNTFIDSFDEMEDGVIEEVIENDMIDIKYILDGVEFFYDIYN